MGGILEESILHHVCIVLLLIWLLSSFNCCHNLVYLFSFIYLYMVHERYVHRLRRKLRFEERRHSNQRRVLCDSESVRWLNYTVEKIWPVCMEQIVSQKILRPIIPWFLQKYKPWTVKGAVVQHLYMGRSPPMFTGIRVLQQSTGDDHLVMELGMNFRTADDMSAILDVKIAKRLGGMRVNLNLMGLHVEGKVLVGVKFLRHWPFLGRLRVCFVEPPYFQMTVKPLFSHGLDVTELPGIAGWLDDLLALAFQQTLVQPNMLVVDMEKFVSPQSESWFSVDEKEPIAYAIVEVIEAVDMKPSDLNGLADPYVKGKLGPYEFETKIQRKTLSPKWLEEFKAPIWSWESPVLAVELHDKDHFSDDSLGYCSITIGDLRDDQRHDMWLPLQNIKMGRLHLAITVVEDKRKGADEAKDGEIINKDNERNSIAETSLKGSSLSAGLLEKSPIVTDTYEPIDIEGQEETGIWVLRPGSEVSQIWKSRKGRNRLLDEQICGEGRDGVGDLKSPASRLCDSDSDSNTDESEEGNKGRKRNKVMRGLQKIGSVFHRHSKKEDTNIRIEEPVPSPHANLKAVNVRESGVKLIVEDDKLSLQSPRPSPVKVLIAEGTESPNGNEQESPNRRNMKDMAKSIFKNRFSREGSKIISQADSGSEVNGREISVGPESSDEESLPSPVCTSEGIPDVSKPISVLGSESFKSKGVNDQTSLCDTAMNIEDPISKVSLEGLQKIGDGPLFSSEGNDDLLVKESDPKQPEENLESR